MSGTNKQTRPCAVVGCKAVDWLAVKTRHSVPRDEPLRSVWLQRIGLRPSDKRKVLLVCGHHFSPDDYFRSPQMVEQMGFPARPVLRPQATPTLHLPSAAQRAPIQDQQTAAAASSNSPAGALQPARVCQCSCRPVMCTVGTQTATSHRTLGTQTSLRGTNAATQVHLDARLLLSQATQTEADSAVLPLPESPSMELHSMAPLPPHFLPPRASSPLLADDTDSDEAESESDDELPAAEPDSSYHVSFDQSFVSDHAAEEATDPHKERKFIVFESKLRQLFASCQHCQEPCQVLFKVEEGSMLRVESTCRVGHTIIWESQPFLNQKPAGNALLAAAILFAGCSVAPCLRALQSINVQAISETTYYTYQKRYLVPAVFKLFQEKQDELVQSVVGTAVDLAGDGRCDSPGHSAKYCTYVLYAGQIGRILHCEHVTVHQSPAVPNSAAMEKEGLINSLEALERQGVNIRSLTTDRHPAIRSFCRKERPTIKHYFDTWHISKGIQKKLRAACKSQSCALIQPWVQCITNHLYFVAAMAEGDAELIISMWRSLLNHICDKHDGHEGPFAECLHEPLGERLWMTPGSPAFLKLQTIVESPSLLRDIRQLSPKVQTYSLESFNSLLIRFAPKSTAFSEAGMKTREKLAVMHFNENTARPQAVTAAGDGQFKVKMPKRRRGHYVVCPKKTNPTFGYVDELMVDVTRRCEACSHRESLSIVDSVPQPQHHMTAAYPRPPKQQLIEARQSRFPSEQRP
ncbi:uncharacterized protein LOC144177721 isoform X2 [Haemaphysalis longicornis]